MEVGTFSAKLLRDMLITYSINRTVIEGKIRDRQSVAKTLRYKARTHPALRELHAGKGGLHESSDAS